MGDIAEQLINEEMFGSNDNFKGYNFIEPRNKEKYSKSTKAIRKELAILIKKKIFEDIENKNESYYVNQAREEINKKYGKGWREQI